MRILILLSSLVLLSQCGGKSKMSDNSPTDCQDAQSYFGEKRKEITWNEELERGEFERGKEKLITDDFRNKYLRNISKFRNKDKFGDLYYHSIPDLQTKNCWVVIEEVVSTVSSSMASHTYYLVDLAQAKILLEVASFEDYPDGKKRMKSIFLDERTLYETKVMEYLGDYNDQTQKYEIIIDSITYQYTIETNRFILTKKDSIRRSKW